MKTLSIRQPWAWMIVEGFKPVENRNWFTDFRGRFLVHTGKSITKAEYESAVIFARKIDPTCNVPSIYRLKYGGIIGEAEIINCVSQCSSPWFVGKFGFVLANPYPLPYMECNGQLGFFDADYTAPARQGKG